MTVGSETEVWGGHIAASAQVFTGEAVQVDLLGGFRHFFVSDTLSITANSVNGPESFTTFDRFLTRNYFYGALGGARATWASDRLEARARLDLAVGVVANNLRVTGSTVRPASAVRSRPGALVVGGGVFSQGSLGSSREARAAVLPEVGLDLGYRLTDLLTLRLGYNFLYLSPVRRAGEQVPATVNARALPVAGGDFNTPPTPSPLYNHAGLSVHGLSAGLELRF